MQYILSNKGKQKDEEVGEEEEKEEEVARKKDKHIESHFHFVFHAAVFDAYCMRITCSEWRIQRII